MKVVDSNDILEPKVLGVIVAFAQIFAVSNTNASSSIRGGKKVPNRLICQGSSLQKSYLLIQKLNLITFAKDLQ